METERHLDWEGCYNVRDLGGMPTDEGGETRWSAVIRSDILERLTAMGWHSLLDYGVRTVIDLRGEEEAVKYPYEMGGGVVDVSCVTYRNMPLEHYYTHVGEMIKAAETRGEVYRIVLDHYQDLVAEVIRAIGNAEPGAVVIHCHAGKDRTGTISMLLLGLAGVSRELIAADYAMSQERLWPLYEKIVEEAGGEENVGFWLKPTVTEAMMLGVLDHLEEKYGGVVGYLKEAGMDEDEIDMVKRRMVE